MEIDKLRPEVREAFLYLDRFENCPSGWTTIRAELLRLADENADLTAQVFGWKSECGRAAEWKKRAEAAEAELAALKARVAEAPTVIFYANGHVSGVHESEFRQRMEVVGKHVRLVVEE